MVWKIDFEIQGNDDVLKIIVLTVRIIDADNKKVSAHGAFLE